MNGNTRSRAPSRHGGPGHVVRGPGFLVWDEDAREAELAGSELLRASQARGSRRHTTRGRRRRAPVRTSS